MEEPVASSDEKHESDAACIFCNDLYSNSKKGGFSVTDVEVGHMKPVQVQKKAKYQITFNGLLQIQKPRANLQPQGSKLPLGISCLLVSDSKYLRGFLKLSLVPQSMLVLELDTYTERALRQQMASDNVSF
ncbi:hypothetical protein AVEN_52615-1 [Araneus ventricosus]|uniref:Uncharacterized protein n=1 Tax=Araneus ventricosus TaxID=182803 RepID=A0A4Y2ENF1_ARAVE|nr:hypothetical protein AVEN_52615-1 [Araneus ventricosus]